MRPAADNYGVQQQYDKAATVYAPQARENDSSTIAEGFCDQYDASCSPTLPPLTDKMTEADFQKDAEAAVALTTRARFIIEEVAKAEKYKARSDYGDIQKEYTDMAGAAWDAAKKVADTAFAAQVVPAARAAVVKG